MVSKNLKVVNKSGLHARPAMFFVQKAQSYKSYIWVENGDRKVSAKSMLGVLALGIAKGMEITIIADGPDEEEAVVGIAELVDSGFAE